MASKIIQAPTPLTLTEIVAAASAFLASLDKGFEMVRKEIEEANNTDFDGIEFLIKGGSAEASRFGKVIMKAEAALGGEVQQAEDGSQVETGEAAIRCSMTDEQYHEIYNELATIGGMVELVREHVANLDDVTDGIIIGLRIALEKVKAAKSLMNAAWDRTREAQA